MPQKNTEPGARPSARRKREEGQALAEYSLILAFVAVASILALTALGVAIAGELNHIAAAISPRQATPRRRSRKYSKGVPKR